MHSKPLLIELRKTRGAEEKDLAIARRATLFIPLFSPIQLVGSGN